MEMRILELAYLIAQAKRKLRGTSWRLREFRRQRKADLLVLTDELAILKQFWGKGGK